MKRLFLTLSLVAASSFLYKCTKVEYVETPRVEPIFSEQAKGWGQLFAENISSIAVEGQKRRKNKALRSDIDIVSLKMNNYATNLIVSTNSFSNARTHFSEEDLEIVTLFDLFNPGQTEYSKDQKKIINRIKKARKQSDSYIEFSNELALINNDIYEVIPDDQQDVLFYITSTIYYTLETIDDLVKNRILPGLPEKGGITLAHLNMGIQSAHAQAEAGDCDGWWDCWGTCVGSTFDQMTDGSVVGSAAGLACLVFGPECAAAAGVGCSIMATAYWW